MYLFNILCSLFQLTLKVVTFLHIELSRGDNLLLIEEHCRLVLSSERAAPVINVLLIFLSFVWSIFYTHPFKV